MNPAVIILTMGNMRLKLRHSNTKVLLFGRGSPLDHVVVRLEDGAEVYLYNREVIQQCRDLDFPTPHQPDRSPQWAVNRFMEYATRWVDAMLSGVSES